MKIVYSHLLNFLEKKPSLEELSDKLFQLGHEHEIEGEILDLEITPNRGDCLSLKGIARDLNHFYKYNFTIHECGMYAGEALLEKYDNHINNINKNNKGQ